MAFLRGVGYSPMDQSSGPAIPGSSQGIVSGGNAGSLAPGSQSSNMQQLPSSVLQNIGQYNSGSTGSLDSSYNQNRGLQSYNQLSSQYGGGNGQWTPWALQDQSNGGYGQSGYQAQNLFLGGGVDPMSVGNRYDQNNGNISAQSIYHNPYSGNTTGYGDLRSYSNPLSGGFWNGSNFSTSSPTPFDPDNPSASQTPTITPDVNAMKSGFNGSFDLSKYGIDPNSKYNQTSLNLNDWQKQAFLFSNPGQTSPGYNNWAAYGNDQKYGNFTPYTPPPPPSNPRVMRQTPSPMPYYGPPPRQGPLPSDQPGSGGPLDYSTMGGY